ncbi:hypothetical protein CH063_08534 [Colletotrichum higginsianum]|uniref:Uncharacterized protein n=1 Tax=Colletotrichum higginsianum (strain IMI 349063) TaxID=759273 RepID=H1VA64_COLHI|nr:hypothetical protein CH063_08534 [Colletotrichum higginsianum]
MEPGFQDPRNCFVFWARPPDHIVRLAAYVQALLKKAAPSKKMPGPPATMKHLHTHTY